MLLNRGSYNGTRIVADSTVALFTKRAAGTRALGWDTCAGHGGCGTYMGPNAYGHTGFTGTSLWIDPDREMFVVLLTNRVHAARARRPAKVISDVRADLADAAALAVTDSRDGVLSMPQSFRADRAVGWNRPEHVAKSRHAKSKRSKSSVRSSRSARSSKSNAKASSKASSKSKVSAKSSRPARSKSAVKSRSTSKSSSASKSKSATTKRRSRR
jgi:cobalamin biosynthesis Mg chelatase CobN